MLVTAVMGPHSWAGGKEETTGVSWSTSSSWREHCPGHQPPLPHMWSLTHPCAAPPPNKGKQSPPGLRVSGPPTPTSLAFIGSHVSWTQPLLLGLFQTHGARETAQDQESKCSDVSLMSVGQVTSCVRLWFPMYTMGRGCTFVVITWSPKSPTQDLWG